MSIDEMISDSFTDTSENESSENNSENKENPEVKEEESKVNQDNDQNQGDENQPEEKPLEETHKPTKSRFQKKIDKQFKKIQVLETLTDRYRQKFGDIDNIPEPNDQDPKYIENKEQYWKDKAYYDMHEQLKAEKEQAEINKKNEIWNEKIISAQKKYKDWDLAIEKIRDINMSDELSSAIQSSKYGTDILHWLGKNREITQQLSQLQPNEQLIKFGIIENKIFEAERKKIAKINTSKAKDPINPIQTGENTNRTIDNMSPDEYLAHYRAKRKKEMMR
jgi:hypothetical protein